MVAKALRIAALTAALTAGVGGSAHAADVVLYDPPASTGAASVPTDVIEVGDHSVWYTDAGRNTLSHFDPGAEIVKQYTLKTFPRLSHPTHLAEGPGGAVYFISEPPVGGGGLGRIDAQGHITDLSDKLPDGRRATHIVHGPDGNVWLALAPFQMARLDGFGSFERFGEPLAAAHISDLVASKDDGNLYATVRGPDGAIVRIKAVGADAGTLSDAIEGLAKPPGFDPALLDVDPPNLFVVDQPVVPQGEFTGIGTFIYLDGSVPIGGVLQKGTSLDVVGNPSKMRGGVQAQADGTMLITSQDPTPAPDGGGHEAHMHSFQCLPAGAVPAAETRSTAMHALPQDDDSVWIVLRDDKNQSRMALFSWQKLELVDEVGISLPCNTIIHKRLQEQLIDPPAEEHHHEADPPVVQPGPLEEKPPPVKPQAIECTRLINPSKSSLSARVRVAPSAFAQINGPAGRVVVRSQSGSATFRVAVEGSGRLRAQGAKVSWLLDGAPLAKAAKLAGKTPPANVLKVARSRFVKGNHTVTAVVAAKGGPAKRVTLEVAAEDCPPPTFRLFVQARGRGVKPTNLELRLASGGPALKSLSFKIPSGVRPAWATSRPTPIGSAQLTVDGRRRTVRLVVPKKHGAASVTVGKIGATGTVRYVKGGHPHLDVAGLPASTTVVDLRLTGRNSGAIRIKDACRQRTGTVSAADTRGGRATVYTSNRDRC